MSDTLRFLPTHCEHGVPIDHKHFGPSLQEGLAFGFPECKDTQKNLKMHIVLTEWPEDTSRESGREIARKPPRKPRSDIGKKRGPRK